ncbi:basic helix-loop-helix protein [Ascosphaera pollenicola]|nr:basic helix-loop-helix protein [Ascosphaera pollenicola]
MRIATLQFAPQVGDLNGNIRKADSLLKQLEERLQEGDDGDQADSSLDLLVLPEMALTGYNFASADHITPYLEVAGQGPSSQWAKSTAKRLKCTVAVGYPEIVKSDSDSDSDSDSSRFNSLFITSPDNRALANYQKRFLYYTDDRWAKEGQNGKGFFNMPLASKTRFSFVSESVEESHIPTAVGICMDINPYKFEAPWHAYEFATHVKESKAKVVILSMAWLTTLDEDLVALLKSMPDMDTFKYWIMRFWPILDCNEESQKMTILVFANRCGIERGPAPGIDDAIYAGSSCVVGVCPRKAGDDVFADIYLWDTLGAAEEGVLYVDTEKKPSSVFRITQRVQNPMQK